MEDFDRAGIAVYALSYDEPDALLDFGDAHGITYTLLSDPDSEVIKSFGILNTLIDETDHPWYGIPYPGAYVMDASGAITQKFFDSNLAVRAGPEQLLRAATGHELLASAASESLPEEVQVNIEYDGDALAVAVQRDLVVRFRVPAGRHVYAEPAPEGMVALDVVLDENERLVSRPLIRPASETHRLTGTVESFEVHHDVFELRLPLTINGAVAEDAAKGGPAEITVSGEVRFQCCDDKVCDIPASQRFELRLPVAESPPVALRGTKGAALEPNAMAHFQRMSERRVTTN